MQGASLHSEPTGAQTDHSERQTGMHVSEYATGSLLLSNPALSPEHQGPRAELREARDSYFVLPLSKCFIHKWQPIPQT